MLVIISDIHLTDGSSGETVHQGTLRVFRERLRSLAYAASWRVDGRYRPIETLDIVLLGDVLDVLRSSRWIHGEEGSGSQVRPWDDPQSQPFIDKVSAITNGILRKNAIFFALLRELRETSIATIPPATADGRPVRTNSDSPHASRVPVRVRIHYMTGNHDWIYHLPHSPYHAVRRQITAALGLENDPNQPFPHDPAEESAAGIRQIFEEHRVFARHGDIYDPFNFEGSRDASSLGDAIVIDLVSSFAVQVKRQLGKSLPPECFSGLKEIDNVRPLVMVPVWVSSLLRRTCPEARLYRQVQEVWNDLASDFMKIPFVRQHFSSWGTFKNAEKLKWALRFSREILNPVSSRFICWAADRIGNRKSSYYPFALREEAFRTGKALFIAYGHTHHHEMVPLTSGWLPPDFSSRLYFNSGTWRPLHEPARFKVSREDFVGFHTMTYLAFFKGDERNGRTFECWSGGLAKSILPAASPASWQEEDEPKLCESTLCDSTNEARSKGEKTSRLSHPSPLSHAGMVPFTHE
ncbi:MAG TPA: hypothetical protein VFZ08_02715 [Terriglobia bacterium]|nr:hypothetical protein [Terriglobia bacterium]